MKERACIELIMDEVRDYMVESYRRRMSFAAQTKEHPNDLLTEADIEVQKRVVSVISRHFPKDLIVAEESGLNGNPEAVPSRCWTIDPIDGTQNFLRGIFPVFGLSLAFLEQGKGSAGCVFLPVTGDRFLAERGKGASWNGKRLAVTRAASLELSRVEIDFQGPKYRSTTLTRVESLLKQAGQLRAYGCGVVGFCHVATGEGELYVNLGLDPWETAVGQLLVEEAGGRVSRLEGSDLLPFDGRSGVIASNGIIHDQVVEMCSEE